MVWNATKTCNLECVHCYADAEIKRFAGERASASRDLRVTDDSIEPPPASSIVNRQ